MSERIARELLRRIGVVERSVTFAAFMVLIAVIFADVISRELTGAGLVWARQIGVYANLFVTMVGIGIASAGGAHIRPRFAERWLPRSWDGVLERLREALMAAFCMAFAVIAAVAVAETRALDERTAMPAWLVWPFEAVIPAVFLVASVRHALFARWPRLAPATGSATSGVGTDGAELGTGRP